MATKRFALHLVLAFLALSVTAADAGADVPSVTARDIYARGKAAYDSGDYMHAARAFAEADALSPNDAVLEIAIAAAVRTDDVAIGLELVERAEARGMTETASTARTLLATRLKIDPPSIPEEIPPPEAPEVTTPIEHPLPITPPLVHSGAADPPSPAWFWAGVATTTVLGAITVGSGMYAVNLHDRFESDRASTALAESGRAAELRTNVLLVTTGVFALATATLGFFVFRREGESRHENR